MRQKDFVNPSKTSFLSAEEVSGLKRLSDQVRSNASPSGRLVLDEADKSFNDVSKSLDTEIDLQHRFKRAGYSFSEATEILEFMKNKLIGIPVSYGSKIFVRTPYNTVVEARIYIDTIQNKLIEFTSLSFFGLIKLAFKRLLGKG